MSGHNEMNPYKMASNPFEYAIRCILGKWKIYILRGIYLHRVIRFSGIKNDFQIDSKVLSKALKELEADDLVVRRVYPEVPVRVEYSVSESGDQLLVILSRLYDWSRTQMLQRGLPIDYVAEMCHGYAEVIELRPHHFFADETPYEYAFKNVLEKWKLYILLGLYVKGPGRFNAIRKILGVTEKVLSAQLKELETCGLIRRIDYATNPPHVEYSTTAPVDELAPILIDLFDWGKQKMKRDGIEINSELFTPAEEVRAVVQRQPK